MLNRFYSSARFGEVLICSVFTLIQISFILQRLYKLTQPTDKWKPQEDAGPPAVIEPAAASQISTGSSIDDVNTVDVPDIKKVPPDTTCTMVSDVLESSSKTVHSNGDASTML